MQFLRREYFMSFILKHSFEFRFIKALIQHNITLLKIEVELIDRLQPS